MLCLSAHSCIALAPGVERSPPRNLEGQGTPLSYTNGRSFAQGSSSLRTNTLPSTQNGAFVRLPVQSRTDDDRTSTLPLCLPPLSTHAPHMPLHFMVSMRYRRPYGLSLIYALPPSPYIPRPSYTSTSSPTSITATRSSFIPPRPFYSSLLSPYDLSLCSFLRHCFILAFAFQPTTSSSRRDFLDLARTDPSW